MKSAVLLIHFFVDFPILLNEDLDFDLDFDQEGILNIDELSDFGGVVDPPKKSLERVSVFAFDDDPNGHQDEDFASCA